MCLLWVVRRKFVNDLYSTFTFTYDVDPGLVQKGTPMIGMEPENLVTSVLEYL